MDLCCNLSFSTFIAYFFDAIYFITATFDFNCGHFMTATQLLQTAPFMQLNCFCMDLTLKGGLYYSMHELTQHASTH